MSFFKSLKQATKKLFTGKSEEQDSIQKQQLDAGESIHQQQAGESGIREAQKQLEARRQQEEQEQVEEARRIKEAQAKAEERRIKEQQAMIEKGLREKEAQAKAEEERRLKEAKQRLEEIRRLKEVREKEEQELRIKEAQAKAEEERRLKEAQQRLEEIRRLKEAQEKEEQARREKEAQIKAEEERRIKEAQQRLEELRRLKEEQEKAEEERRLREAQEKAEEERRIKEAQAKAEEERRIKEAQAKAEEERRIKEAQEKAEEEHRIKEAQEKAEEERRLKEAQEKAEEERRIKEAQAKAEEERRQKEVQEKAKEERIQNEIRRLLEKGRLEQAKNNGVNAEATTTNKAKTTAAVTVSTPSRMRKNVGKSQQLVPTTDLLAIQHDSFNWFIKHGLRELLHDMSPIEDFTGNQALEFIDYTIGNPKYEADECKEHHVTYAAPLHVRALLHNKSTDEVKVQDVFFGNFPLMTETGTFIINGAERTIISQLVRAPSIYFHEKTYKQGKKGFGATVIPNRGAWLEYETDGKDVVYVRIDRTRKLPVTVLLRALGFGTDQEIIDIIGDNDYLRNTLEKDYTGSTNSALIEIYERLRPGEPPTVEAAKNLLYSRFFDAKRYDLANVGRYKINNKLQLKNRLLNQTIAETIVNSETGEILVEAGTLLDRRTLDRLLPALEVFGMGINVLSPSGGVVEEDVTIQSIKVYAPNDEAQKEINVISNAYIDEEVKNLTPADILASVSYFFNLLYDVGNTDDIDHLGNRRLRSVGELLQNQFRIGLSRMERVVRERMSINDSAAIVPQQLINIRPIIASIIEFFGESYLSQYLDQTNPLAELTHKRRLTALGPGGLTVERAGMEVRDVHYSHYGRICPIETPEGPNIGLVHALSLYARVNKYGFIETPYRRVNPLTGAVTEAIHYLTADDEDHYAIAQSNALLHKDGTFVSEKVTCKYLGDFKEINRRNIDYIALSSNQMLAASSSSLPFLEHVDATRATMGANMQRQAVPLLDPKAPLVGTGTEHMNARASGAAVIAKKCGVVEHVEARAIFIRTLEEIDGKEMKGDLVKYRLQTFVRSNLGTPQNQRPIVRVGDYVKQGDLLADGSSMEHGEMALGQNILTAFMPWDGYNYNDSIIISERLQKDDVFTSVHIEEYEIESRDTKLGPEEITRDIRDVAEEALRNLDKNGIVRIGAEVREGDILVGKVTPKGITELTTEERLLHAIFGEKSREVRDTSLRVPHGAGGLVLDVKVLYRENGDELPPGVNQLVRVYIGQKRKIRVGDKLAGRHGNKGVISRILPQEEMPFMPDGTPIDMLINPLGVPTRMNIGQLFELNLGMAALRSGQYVTAPVFDDETEGQLAQFMQEAGMATDGKTVLYDGRTGEPFDQRISVGMLYMNKLAHMVDDRIHARSTGPYSIVTQQPLGGRAHYGGQRFGEMEVWALEAYGAAHTLQEMLTVKSDDVVGRVGTYEAILKGENLPKPSIPESFKVLVRELQALGMEPKLLTVDDEEVDIFKDEEDEEVDEEVVVLTL